MHVLKIEMARDSTVGQKRVVVVPGGLPIDGIPIPTQPPDDISQEILELKKEQEIQKQMLWHTFQEKNKQLELQHKLQLEHKYQFAAHSNGVFQELREHHHHHTIQQHHQQQKQQQQQQQQQQQLVQRERKEREMKRKETNSSANASTEVKQILQTFLMNKKQAATNGIPSPYRNWGVVKSSSGESLPVGASAASTSTHPYKISPPPSAIAKSDADFRNGLRKTASEPNLKFRLKQSVLDRSRNRCGPLAGRRPDRRLQKQPNAALVSSNPNCVPGESGPNSPPITNRGSPSSAPIQEENEDPNYQANRGSINDIPLFSSPSMPNISLGRPPLAGSHTANGFCLFNNFRTQAQMAAAAAAALAAAAASGNPPNPADITSAYFGSIPSSTSIDLQHLHQQQLLHHHHQMQLQQQQQQHQLPHQLSSSSSNNSSDNLSIASSHRTTLEMQQQLQQQAVAALQLTAHNLSLHQVPQFVSPPAAQPITDAQVAHARLHKQGHRPLGRTQSAPLPLGHPKLTGVSNVQIGQVHYEDSEAERQAIEQKRLYLTKKIRQSVLTKANRELTVKEEETNEVIDLTDKKQPPKTVITSSVVMTNSTSQSNIYMPEAPKQRDSEYLKHQREVLMRQSMHMPVEDPFARGFIRPLSRTLSSPLVHLGPHPLNPIPDTGQGGGICHSSSSSSSLSSQQDTPPPVNLTMPHRRNMAGSPPNQNNTTTGLAFDNLMLKHSCICGDNSSHPEHSGRLQSVWARLVETGLASRCDRLRSRKATQEELQTVHTEAHAMLFGTNQLNRQKLEASRVSFVRLACGGLGVDLDTTWNEHHTASAARMAAGCVIDLAIKTAKGEIRNGFAVVRPPGHHAEPDTAMGFCFFNSVAVAAKVLRQRVPEVQRILIVDWDVHHGNGTQQVFYDDPNVLYLSIHRHDDGNFFPGTGGPTECGAGIGLGANVNVAWSGGLSPPLGDAEYLAAFRTIVMPIAKDFAPDLVLVSAGFDAAIGHPPPLGGYLVSPACFGHLTRELMRLANGKVVLALEGGYDLPAICDSAQECVKALLGDELVKISDSELNRPPCENAIETLQKTIAIQMTHWPSIKRMEHTIGFSAVQAMSSEREESETVTAMAGLSMQSLNRSSRDLSHDDSEEPMDQDDK